MNAVGASRRKECGATLGEFADATADVGDEALCMASARFVTN